MIRVLCPGCRAGQLVPPITALGGLTCRSCGTRFRAGGPTPPAPAREPPATRSASPPPSPAPIPRSRPSRPAIPETAAAPTSASGDGFTSWILGFAFVLLVAGTAIATVYLLRPAERATESAGLKDPWNGPSTQASTARVVAGARITLVDGSQKFLVTGTASGFLVTRDGVILTSRRIVAPVDHAARLPTLEGRLSWLLEQRWPRVHEALDRLELDVEESTEAAVVLAEQVADVEPLLWAAVRAGRELPPLLAPCKRIPLPHAQLDLALLESSLQTDQPYALREVVTEHDLEAPVLAAGYPHVLEAPATAPLTDELDLAGILGLVERVELVVRGERMAHTVSRGRIGRAVLRKEAGRELVMLEHDAPLGSGSAGSPLVTENATVLGLNALIGSANRKDGKLSYALGFQNLRPLLDEAVPGILWR